MARDAGTENAVVMRKSAPDDNSDINADGCCYAPRAQLARELFRDFASRADHHAIWISAAVCSQREQHTFKTSRSAQRQC